MISRVVAALLALHVSTFQAAAQPVLLEGDPLPIEESRFESIPGVTTFYRSVAVDEQTHLRLLITRPEGARTPLRPLLFTQWVSCGSIVYRAGYGTAEIFAHLARYSGLSLVRVERSGTGDSTGVACSDLDYDTELAHYEAAFLSALGDELIDDSELFFYGSSLGSTTAPILAHRLQQRGHRIAGIAVQGGGGYSYLERMLAFEQHYLDRRPMQNTLASRTTEFADRARFLIEYLVGQRHPDEVAEDDAAMKRVRGAIMGMDETGHYGRPFRWHQQAASKNFLASWSALETPVIVLFNEYDQYESLYGATLISDTLNRREPGSATLVQQSGLSHSSYFYPDTIAAYNGVGGSSAWSETAGRLLSWLTHVQAEQSASFD